MSSVVYVNQITVSKWSCLVLLACMIIKCIEKDMSIVVNRVIIWLHTKCLWWCKVGFGVHFNICLYHGNETREEITINCNLNDCVYNRTGNKMFKKKKVFLKEVNEHAVFSGQTV